MSFDIYGDRAVEAMALIREFVHVEYWEYFKGDPERALEAFCVMQDAAEAKSASRIADLEAQVFALHKQLGYETKPDNSQDWAGISGAVAFHLIERHADNWSEAGDMMEAFAASRAPKAAGGVPQWQPIETAPKDGEEVFLWLPSPYERIEKVRWFDLWENWQIGEFPDDSDEYCGIGSALPTHWMPLPAAPQVAEQTKQQEPK